MSHLVGTAGHVDHGKTSLIRALTGIDADRLPEEKKRGLTIDIGFAYIDLPQSGRVSLIDVPGHERFITNMLVGATAMEVALLCIAADVGVMPQTREHFEILNLLPVKKLIIVVTRCDLADELTLELLGEEVDEMLAETRFIGAEKIETSAKSGLGIDALSSALDRALVSLLPQEDSGWFLPVDRVFVQPGHGTIVTGSLQGGEIKGKKEVKIWPGERSARVRAIQVHGELVEAARPGQRVAINLGGVSADEVERGDLIAESGQAQESDCFDAEIQIIKKVNHGQRVRISVGSAEVIGKVFLNDHDDRKVQFRLEKSVGLRSGMPLVMRRYSPPEVLGGGLVTLPKAKKWRKSTKLIDMSENGLNGLFAETGLALETQQIGDALGWSDWRLSQELEEAKRHGVLHSFAGLWMSPETYQLWQERFSLGLAELHKKNPTKGVLPKDAVGKAVEFLWPGKPLDRLVSKMIDDQILRSQGNGIALIDHRPILKDKQRLLLDRVIEILNSTSPNIPNAGELSSQINVPQQAIENILEIGVESGELARLEDGVYFTVSYLEELKGKVRKQFAGTNFSAAEFRDWLATSRKFAIPLVEYFDRTGLTVRQGETRVVIQDRLLKN